MSFEAEVDASRRTVFWQRVYLQTLAQLMAQGAQLPLLSDPDLTARVAGRHAAQAVRQLDEWRKTVEPPAPNPAPSRDHESDEDEDDSDGGYLGSGS